jgi:uncharacterized membrane protein
VVVVVVVEERFSFGCVVLPVQVVGSGGGLGLLLEFPKTK